MRMNRSGMNMITLDDLKVSVASATGIGNWMLQIDVLLKVAISVATLVYIVLKIKQQLKDK
jgi:hypothetical protein